MASRTQYTPSAACFKRVSKTLALVDRPINYRTILAAMADESIYNPPRAVREFIDWLHEENRVALLRMVARACAQEADELRTACRAYVTGRELLDRECRYRWPNFAPLYPSGAWEGE